LEDRQTAMNRLKVGFTREQSALANPEIHDQAVSLMGDVTLRLGGDGADVEGLVQSLESRKRDLQTRIELYQWLSSSVGKVARPIELLVGLDLSDHGSRVGPMFIGYFQRASTLSLIQQYNDWFQKLQRGYNDHAVGTEWWGGLRNIVD